jgi:hypothetical protein
MEMIPKEMYGKKSYMKIKDWFILCVRLRQFHSRCIYALSVLEWISSYQPSQSRHEAPKWGTSKVLYDWPKLNSINVLSLLDDSGVCLEQNKLQLRSASGIIRSAIGGQCGVTTIPETCLERIHSVHQAYHSFSYHVWQLVFADENILVDVRITFIPRIFLLQEMAPCFPLVKCGGFV